MSQGTPASAKPSINAVLVFDGDCAMCIRSVDWIRRRLPQQPRIVPWQELDLDTVGLTARECHDAVQWVEPGGRESGARAVGRLLQHQRGAWALVAWIPFVWPFSALAETGYRIVVRTRNRSGRSEN